MIERSLKELMYIVYDYEDGLVIQTTDYEEALKEYNRCIASWQTYFDGEFSTDEKTVLAVVLKDFYSDEIEEKNDNGDNYWSFHEDTYDTVTIPKLSNELTKVSLNSYLHKAIKQTEAVGKSIGESLKNPYEIISEKPFFNGYKQQTYFPIK